MGIYSDKLWAACQLIKEYNTQLKATQLPTGVNPRKELNSEKFVEKLVLYGGVADELLRQCSWEDLENCGLPRLLARKVAAVFRATDVPNELTAHSEMARKWLPLLKKWNVSWKDYVGLVDRLELAREMCKDGLASGASLESLTEGQVLEILEQIRDEYMENKFGG